MIGMMLSITGRCIVDDCQSLRFAILTSNHLPLTSPSVHACFSSFPNLTSSVSAFCEVRSVWFSSHNFREFGKLFRDALNLRLKAVPASPTVCEELKRRTTRRKTRTKAVRHREASVIPSTAAELPAYVSVDGGDAVDGDGCTVVLVIASGRAAVI